MDDVDENARIVNALQRHAAVVVQKSFSLVGDKAILVAVFLLVVSPLLTHLTGRAARIAEHGDWRHDDIEVEEP